ncbi:MAG: FAD-dependent oxidoreductase [Bacteroidales bacterium]|nr:FAD-dependent oxidoreductase [Bacteroidales bacterium]
MRPKNTRPTIRDVAREAGVSTTLVSLVINARVRKDGSLDCPVNAATAERIQYVVKRLNYRPNTAAVSLRSGRRKTIGVICPDMGRQYFAEISKYIESLAYEKGYTVLFGSSEDKVEKLGNLISTFVSDGVEGILVTPCPGSDAQIQKAISLGIPIVLMTRDSEGLNGVGRVLLNNKKGIRIALEHLLSRGFRRIEMVSNSWGLSNMTARENLYMEMMSELGLSHYAKIMRVDDEHLLESMEAIMSDAIKRGTEAILYPGASLGRIGFISMKRLSKKIPEDLAILSFDGGNEYTLLSPSITQIQQSRLNTARESLNMLIGMSHGEAPRTVLLEPIFNEGESTKAVYADRMNSRDLSVMSKNDSVLVPAASLDNRGGWTLESQFIDSVGSSYLLAHGLGHPVSDASGSFIVPRDGDYNVYVRTMNWASDWAHGRSVGTFRLSIDNNVIHEPLGTKGAGWNWQDIGKYHLQEGSHSLRMHDLDGLDGRVDSVLLTTTDYIPDDDAATIRYLRLHLLGEPTRNIGQGYDLVVAGGGISGICAAVTAARRGLMVALIQDRPVLGGDNSSEVRLGLRGPLNLDPYPSLGYLMNEIGPRSGGDYADPAVYEDDRKLRCVLAEKNISLFLGHKVSGARVRDGRIQSVTALNVEDYSEMEFSAHLYADCTGDASLGVIAGVECLYPDGVESFRENTEHLRDSILFDSIETGNGADSSMLFPKWQGHVMRNRGWRKIQGKAVLSDDNIHSTAETKDACIAGDAGVVIPLSCLYSRSISNLFMAGRSLSSTIGSDSTLWGQRTMGISGEVVGLAAAVCRHEECLPEDIVPRHWSQMESLLKVGAGRTDVPYTQTYDL